MRALAAAVAAALAADEGWELPPELPPLPAIPAPLVPVVPPPTRLGRRLTEVELERAALAQARREADQTEWFIVGLGGTCLLSCVGFGVTACYAHEGPVSEPEVELPEDQRELFVEVYEKEVRNVRTEQAVLGGLVALGVVAGAAIGVAVLSATTTR